MFSPEVVAALEDALREPWQGTEPPDSLRRAVLAAAREARSTLLRPEELLVAFKDIEERAIRKLPHGVPPAPDTRARLIRELLVAFYQD